MPHATGPGVEDATARLRSPRRGVRIPFWQNADAGPRLTPGARLRRDLALSLADRRLFLLFPFGMIVGLIVYRMVGDEPHWSAVSGLLAVGLAWFFRAWRNGRPSGSAMLALGLIAGFTLLPLHGAIWGTKMLGAPVYGTYRASVDRVLYAAADGQRVIVSHISALSGRDPDVRRARLFVRDGPQLSPGMLIEGNVRFAPVPGPAYPGGYDAQFISFFSGIGAYGASTRAPRVVRTDPAGWWGAISSLRTKIGARLDALVNTRTSGILRALVVGDQSGIDGQTRDTLARAGLAHVLAISGLHLSLVAGGVFAAARFALAGLYGAGQRYEIKKWAALLGIAAALAYLAISGGPVSAVRATITLVLVFGAVLLGRRALTMRNVALAAMAILFMSPQSAFSAGFQLSFAAVVALVGTYEFAKARPFVDDVRPAGFWLYFKGLAMTSLVAGGATAVFAAYHFQQTAPLGVVGNVLAVPVVGLLVLPAAALGVIAMPLGIEAPFLQVAGWGVEQILAIARLVDHLSGPLAMHPMLSPVALLMALAALAWFAFFSSSTRFVGPALAVPAILIFAQAQRPEVLISDMTQAVAVRGEGGYQLIAGRHNSFVVRVWEEKLGVPIAPKSKGLCGQGACVVPTDRGGRVAYLAKSGSPRPGCGAGALVIARWAKYDFCDQAQTVRAADLRRQGVTLGFWRPKEERFELVPAIADDGRPWRPTPR